MLNSTPRRALHSWLTVATIAALAGCGGASSQGALPISAASQAAISAARAPAPWPSAGATLSYAGTLQQSGSNGRATLQVTQNVTTSQATYRGRPVTDYQGVETVRGKGTNEKTTFVAYVASAASKIRIGSDIELVKSVSRDSTGITQTTIYGNGNGVFDQLPEVPQARWNDTAARTVSIANSVAGSSIHDTYHADGSYDENAIPVQGRTASSQSYPDGNAVYQFPFQGGSMNSTVSFAPPAGGKLQILFVNFLLHVTQLYTLNDWYPATPPPLAGDSFQNAGTVQIPSACNVPKHYGQTATEISEQVTRLDIVFGEYETTQRTAYVEAPYGLVCLDVHDELDTYYDFDADAFSGKPLTTEVTDETLGLQHAQLPKNSTIGATSVALPLDSNVVSMQAAARLKTERAIFYSLQHLRKNR